MTGAGAGEPRSQRAAERASLTVAVTGPTGDIGRALMRALDREPTVGRVIGMARSPFDPAAAGWEKAEYRRGDILDRDALVELVAEADVVVHLAFVIIGGREETRRVNLDGSRNVFEAAIGAGVERLVYTSSVAAYGFHPDNPQPLREEIEPRGSEGFYYSAQKAELERTLAEAVRGSEVDTYVFRPCIVAGPEATTLVEKVVEGYQLGGRLPFIQRALDGLPFIAPVLPDPGTPFQLVHHDDVADALVAAVAGRGEPGTYNLAGEGELRASDLARELGWWSAPIPRQALAPLAETAARVPGLPTEASWLRAVTVPVLMDTERARSALGWRPAYDAAETLIQTVEGARREGLLG